MAGDRAGVNPDHRPSPALPFGSVFPDAAAPTFVAMETHSEKNSRVARLLGPVTLLGAGAGATVWLSPGGLGEADTTEVTKGASDRRTGR